MTLHNRHHTHPAWCAKDETCTADGQYGQHRSRPITWENPTIRITATRLRVGACGHDRLELVTVALLDDNPATAEQQSKHLIARTWMGAVAGLCLTERRYRKEQN